MNDEQQRSAGFDGADHLRMIWRARAPVLLASLAVATVVFAWSSQRQATYEATATMSVEMRGTAQGRPAADDVSLAASRYAELATTRPVLEESIRAAELDLDPDDLEASLSVEASSTPGFLSVTASSVRPDQAAAIAAGVAEAIVTTVEEAAAADLASDLQSLEDELTRVESELRTAAPSGSTILQTRYEALVSAITERRLQPQDSLRVASPATVPTGPVSPKPARDALLALAVALVVNGELVVAGRSLGNRIARGGDIRREVEAATGLPVLALLPPGEGLEAEGAFRELRTNLGLLTPTDGCRSVSIVGDNPSTGTASVAAGLAMASAVGDRRVVLVDADLRHPSVHSLLDITRGTGLGEVLTERADVAKAMQVVPTVNGRLWVLAAGGVVPDPAYALSSGFADGVLAVVEEGSSLVVVDGAAAVFAEGLVVAAACDLTILVLDARSSRRDTVADLVRRLRQVGANPVGVVVAHAVAGGLATGGPHEGATLTAPPPARPARSLPGGIAASPR